MEKKNGATRVRFNIMNKILAITLIPLLTLVIVGTVYSARIIRLGMEDEALKRLADTVDGVMQALNALDEGDFYLEGETLYKGEENILEKLSYFETFSEQSQIDITLFYGDVRRVTTLKDQNTGEHIVGTQAADHVKSMVLEKGQSFTDMDLQLSGQDYFCYYAPMKNADGTIVGMIFAGEPSSGIRQYIYSGISKVVIMSLVIIALGTVVVIWFARRIGKAIQMEENVIEELAAGNLHITINPQLKKRQDELGKSARALDYLVTELSDILCNIQKSSGELMESGHLLDEMAERVNTNAGEIGRAVGEISEGASTQAEEIEHASGQIMDMGSMIEHIAGGVEKLNTTSITMKQAGDTSAEIMQHLAESTDRTNQAIQKIGAQVYATNESAQKIQEAVEIISTIADQTSLLSLNASIEAAKAGEFGKGFAVVASEIQKLADESSQSAQIITDVIAALLTESDMTVKVMQEVETIISEQREKLEATQKHFAEVEHGINSSREDTGMIEERTRVCDDSRKTVVDVIENLSALSQENAASAQETTASMEELGATTSMLLEAANNLKRLSDQIDEEMKFFQL
ncbi:MAG: methyl-accepting chemotaxis protein [Lachnospiraceae bacterium]|nr:methyl-accepting chemotaxis protein [Lachnospiraceae bacterium]